MPEVMLRYPSRGTILDTGQGTSYHQMITGVLNTLNPCAAYRDVEIESAEPCLYTIQSLEKPDVTVKGVRKNKPQATVY
jgi:hypothetical protein